jgi:hypothetical protein
MDYHVAITGNDNNAGACIEAPFRTISKAASIALPGDNVYVHGGVYREWVSPENAGTVNARITFQAACGEVVTISGAEQITDWLNVESTIWKTVISNSFFGDYNPYQNVIGGDWFFTRDKVFHTGEVYLNGKSMYEAETLDDIKNPAEAPDSNDKQFSLYKWCAVVESETTTIFANFHGADPRKECVEINVRPHVFWPRQTGRNYITVRGFKLKQAATNWAPPTALQTGLIGPHWSRGWIIENNEISDSKCSGVSLGTERETGDNEWTKTGYKLGHQREQEVIFRALHNANWNKENIGGHIVRNNIIHDCEQAGIVGHLGGAFSTIEHNHIYRIHYKRQWHGAEVGGIKLHASLDTQIYNNFIHHCYRALWLDWQAQGTYIKGNVFYNNQSEDFMAEVCHGPFTLENNLFLSKWSVKDMSEGAAFVHNLFLGKIASCAEPNRHTPYHFPHDTAVAGCTNITGGDDRFYNNIFIAEQNDNEPFGKVSSFWDGAVIMDGVPAFATFKSTPAGTSQYDDCPGSDEMPVWKYNHLVSAGKIKGDPEKPVNQPPGTPLARYNVYIANNLYLNGAVPYAKETNAAVHSDAGIEVKITDPWNAKIKITITKPENLRTGNPQIITTEILGAAHTSEQKFENAGGTPFYFDKDYSGRMRTVIVPGPFEITEKTSFEVGY